MHRMSAIRRSIAVFALLILMGSLPCMGECLLADALQSPGVPCNCHKHPTPLTSHGVVCHSDAAAPQMFSDVHVPWQDILTAQALPIVSLPDCGIARVSMLEHPPDGAPPPSSVLRI